MALGVSSISRLLRLASRIICLIVIAWFAVFAVDQTSTASTHQQNELAEGRPPADRSGESNASTTKQESTAHRVLDDASNALTSPFAGAVSGSHSEWTIHIVKTVLALLVYGFGLAFLARFLRVRV